MSRITELEEKVTELMKEIETLKREKKNEEFEYQFEEDEQFWILFQDGDINYDTWKNYEIDTKRYDQGNIFKTKQEAIRERDKRVLLTRFRQFRDKCNGEWKPETYDCKFFISYDGSKNVLESGWNDVWDNFNTFGYFYDERDCLRAIELFGDEIKRLFVEG